MASTLTPSQQQYANYLMTQQGQGTPDEIQNYVSGLQDVQAAASYGAVSGETKGMTPDASDAYARQKVTEWNSAPPTATTAAPVTYSNDINQIYQQQLGRDADADGAAYWGGLLQSGVSVDDIISGINASNEGKQYDLATVNKAYQDNFGRPAESVGADYWFNKAQTSALSSSLLSEAIRNAAQADDVKARDDNAVYSSAWTPGWDVNSSGYRYNPDSDKWEINTSSDQPQNVPAVATNVPSGQPRNITPNETVSHQLNTLLSENSPYMQSATNRAMEQANSRGLLNSSIAVGAGQRAAIDAALPIAQQDAQTYATSGLADQNFGYQTALNEQNFRFDTALADQQAANARALQAQSDAARLVQLEKQGDINLKAQTQKELADQATAKYLNETISSVDLQKLDAADRSAMTSNVNQLFRDLQASVATILTAPDSQFADQTSRQNAINFLTEQTYANAAAITAVYGYKFEGE